MIFFARDWSGQANPDLLSAGRSLGLFAGHSADSFRDGFDYFAQLSGPRAKPRPSWRPATSPSNWPVLFHGWLDNAPAIATELGIPLGDDAYIYGAAVERWGDEADNHLVGTYAALVCCSSEVVRLARSPWSSRSLFYARHEGRLIVSSITRPIFAEGVAKRLRQDAIDAFMTFSLPDRDRSLFEGISVVPVNHVLHIRRDRVDRHQYYEPANIAPVHCSSDEEYIEAANALLADAVEASLKGAQFPGVTLSGGLDSAIVCDEIVRQREGRPTKSFTFTPLGDWDGFVPAHKFGNDEPYVREFARMHPQLETFFVDNRGKDFDYREAEWFLASDSFYPARVLSSVYFGLYETAREQGCDWLLFAGSGNMTMSNEAPWAYAEFLRRGQWKQLWRLAGAHINDDRPMWRRIASLGLLPNLPRQIRTTLRKWVHRGLGDPFSNAFIRTDSQLARDIEERRGLANIYSYGNLASRSDYIREVGQTTGMAAEMWEASEQIFGIRSRDVTAYRPLIEFCLGLPTRMFARDGETRWLARQMAKGRMPEAQRTNRLYGDHNTDWHARYSARLPELRQRVKALEDHPEIGQAIDHERMLAALDNWPRSTPRDAAEASLLRFTLPAVLTTANYLDFVSGRNRA